MIRSPHPVRLAAGLALTLLAAPLALAKSTIADLAPPNSVLIAGTDDYTAMRASFDRTGLKKIWDDPTVQAWFKKNTAEAMEEFTSTLEDLGMKRDDIVPPTGMAGLALWVVPTEDPTVPPVQMLWAGDFGPNADNLHTKIVAALEKAEGANHLKFESEEFGGATLFTVTHLDNDNDNDDAKDADDHGQDDGDDDADMEDWEDWENAGADSGPEYTTVYYARSGSSLMLCTSQRDAEDAINRLAGKGDTSVRANNDLGKAMTIIGPSQVYAVMLNQPLYEIAADMDKKAAALVADDPSNPPSPQIMQTLGALGISNVRSLALGMNFDGDKGIAESTFVANCPEIKGIMTLFASDPRPIGAPSFVTADAASYSAFQVHFERLIPAIKDAIQTLPAEMAAQAGYALPMVEGQIGSILANLGPEIHIVQQYAQPYAVDSDHSVFAIAVKDTAALSTDLGLRGQQLGLVSREFQGAQIWGFPEGGSPLPLPPEAQDMALGVGFGHFFIGKTASVEGAMRLAANPSGASLGADARFKKAVSVLKSPGLSFSYTNLPRSIAYAKWMVANFEKIQNEQFEKTLAQIDDPDFKQMMIDNKPEAPAWLKDLPDLSIISRELGDLVGEMHITPDGFVGTSYILRPSN